MHVSDAVIVVTDDETVVVLVWFRPKVDSLSVSLSCRHGKDSVVVVVGTWVTVVVGAAVVLVVWGITGWSVELVLVGGRDVWAEELEVAVLELLVCELD